MSSMNEWQTIKKIIDKRLIDFEPKWIIKKYTPLLDINTFTNYTIKEFSGEVVPQEPNEEPESELFAKIKAEKPHPEGSKESKSVKKVTAESQFLSKKVKKKK